MVNINVIAARGVDSKRLELFKLHLTALLSLFTQAEVGSRMGVNRSNINRYIRGTLPITKGFLMKFYTAWQDSINKDPNIQKAMPISPNENAEPTLNEVMKRIVIIEAKLSRLYADQTVYPQS